MINYIKGLFKNLFKKNISLFTIIDGESFVNSKAKTYRFVKIFRSKVGAYTYICNSSQLVCAEVGKYCSIAPGCQIGNATHTLNFLSTSPIFTEKRNATGTSWVNENLTNPFLPVKIGNDVWIGARAMVMGGVKIGNGAVIGAGAIVTKDVPPYAICVGVPAKVVRYRFPQEIIEKLEKINWWDWPEEVVRERISLFQKPNLEVKDI